MCMFGITAFMFALGVIALVLETAMWFLTAEPDFDVSNGDTLYAGCYYVWANYYMPDGAFARCFHAV